MYTTVIYNNVFKVTQLRKEIIFHRKWYWENCPATCKTNDQKTYYYLIYKLNAVQQCTM